MVETPEGKEGWQPSCSLDPHAKENAIMDEIIKIEDSHLKDEYSRTESAWKSSLCLRKKKRMQCKIQNTNFELGNCDPDNNNDHSHHYIICWIGFQRKCYYFSEAEGNWTASSLHCSSHNASLAVIDSQEEMHFLLRYKSPPDHWIGLRRDNPEQPWKWINGTIFRKRFTIYGGGRCAYMISDAIASSSCSREEHWICSKPIENWYHVTV